MKSTASALSRVLTDRGTEFCGTQSHEYELYLAVEDIDHSRTKTKSPQTNGICERFHRTVLDEFYRVAFRKKIYHAIEELQTTSTPGSPTTTPLHHTHLSMPLKRRDFVDQDVVPRGVLRGSGRDGPRPSPRCCRGQRG